MTPERWVRVQELFQRVLECDPGERNACLDAACAGDPSLREEVESLITSEPEAHGFLHDAVNAAMNSYGLAATASLTSTQPAYPGADFEGTERFSIEHRLGAGGFGTVYRAFDRERNTTVALKTLHHPDAHAILGFKREFRALADISHPNLVTLYELIADGQRCFFTMELVEGVNFREYVRDFARLRPALKQLVLGVSALHAAHKLHRDLKPSNVLVTRQGRVVILDFGLVADTSGDALGQYEPAGTPEYMSPEQRTCSPLSEASDWYAVGIMLYEALTGRRPPGGASHFRSPSELEPGVPQDLSDLCVDLLRTDPGARPSGDEVCRRLGVTPADIAGRKVPFVGRENHLRILMDGFESTKAGRPAAIYIHGSSGIGKTALAQCFLERVQQQESVLVLEGRCYEQESLPFKAIDGVIDALSVYLKNLSPQVLRDLVPAISVVARMFPVLQRVTVMNFAKGEQDPVDLQEQRRRGFVALRDLFARLVKERPVIIFIDDLQWGDSDGANLVAELLRPPDAPPVFLIGCYRTEEASTSPFLQSLSSEHGIGAANSSHLALSELDGPEAQELASALLGGTGDGEAGGAEDIARHCGGNPFFIGELARYVDSQSELPQRHTTDTPTLDDLVKARLSALPEPARHFLEMIAVAGQPLDSGIARRVREQAHDELAIVAQLRATRLIRTRTTKDGQELEAYHDRIRETVSAGLPADVARDLHLRLGRALETSAQPRLDLLVMHFAAADHKPEALHYSILAADQASSALAFDSAARFYRMALQFEPAESDQVCSIRRKLGDALSNAGRGAEAAGAYLTAAEIASPSDALEDRRRAALQFLGSGHIDEGRTVIQTLLSSIGMKLAPSPRRALVSLLIGRVRINLRGLHYRERAAGEIAPKDLIRIDTCWSVAHGLGLVDTIHAADFQARHILLALRAGEKYRVSRALSVEAVYQALGGIRHQNRTRQILQTAMELSRTCENPHALGFSMLTAGICAFLEGRWKSGQDWHARAEKVLLERCIGTVWELATARLMWSAASFFLGDLRELSTRLPVLIADADTRGDLYQATALRTRIAHAGPLAADQPEQALEIVTGAIAKWSVQGFHIQHWWTLIAQTEITCYQGRGMEAWALIDKQWPDLRASLLLRFQYIRIESLHRRAGSALAAAAEAGSNTARRRNLLRAAGRDAARIERESAPWGYALSLLIRGGVKAIQGNEDDAVRLLLGAEGALESADMRLYAAAARRRRGRIIQGDQGAALVKSADLWMAGQGIQSPERFTAMLAPGY